MILYKKQSEKNEFRARPEVVNRQLFLFLNHFLGTHPSTPVVLDGLFVLGKVVFNLDLGADPRPGLRMVNVVHFSYALHNRA